MKTLLSILFTISIAISQNLPEEALNYPGHWGARSGCNHWNHPTYGPYYAPIMWAEGNLDSIGRLPIRSNVSFGTIVSEFPVTTLYILMMNGWTEGTLPRLMDPTWTGTNTCQLYVGINSTIIGFRIGTGPGTGHQPHLINIVAPNMPSLADSYFVFQWIRYFDDSGVNRILTSPGCAIRIAL